MAAVVASLAQITEEHPYLKPMGTEPMPHQLLYWVRRCRECIIIRNSTEAMSCVERIQRSLNYEMAQIKDAFRRFDADSSGHLDQNEFKYLCAYIGWGEEEAQAMIMDLDQDQKVSYEEFQLFVGHMGGLQALFENRRKRVANKNWGEDPPAVIEVLEMNVMPENGVRLLFGFGEDKSERQAGVLRKVVPPGWIFYDSRDSEVVAALREVGILEEQQAFWASIFPQSEMRAVRGPGCSFNVKTVSDGILVAFPVLI
ncbi:cal-1 [Symbiodinium sp. KB8]|nr:cal-1 [Symbiodinium sp. KB8]